MEHKRRKGKKGKLEGRIDGREVRFWGTLDVDAKGRKGTFTTTNGIIPDGVELVFLVSTGARQPYHDGGTWKTTYEHTSVDTGEHIHRAEKVK